MYYKSLRSNENSSFKSENEKLNRVLQEQNQLIGTEKERVDLHIGELNLKITSLIDEINSKNETIEESQKKIVEL